MSTGTGEGDFDKISAIIAAVPQLHYICVDVANGYSEHFVHFVKDVRDKFPTHTIMVSKCAGLNCKYVQMELMFTGNLFYFAQAGNVVTGEMVEELILAGADIIKVGIGPGNHTLTFPGLCVISIMLNSLLHTSRKGEDFATPIHLAHRDQTTAVH